MKTNGSNAVAAVPQTATGDGGGRPPVLTLVGDGDDSDAFDVGDTVQVQASLLREWLGIVGKVVAIVEPEKGFGTRWYVVQAPDTQAVHFEARELRLVSKAPVVVPEPDAEAVIPPWLVGAPPQVVESWLAYVETEAGYATWELGDIETKESDSWVPDTAMELIMEGEEPTPWKVALVDLFVTLADNVIDVIELYEGGYEYIDADEDDE